MLLMCYLSFLFFIKTMSAEKALLVVYSNIKENDEN